VSLVASRNTASARSRSAPYFEDFWMLTAVLDEDRLLSDKSQNHVDNGRVAA
jgi:hypothetical protein